MDVPPPPRYRIEHRHPDLAPLIVAFVDSLKVAHLAVATKRSVLRRRGLDGELVIVDQETEANVKSFDLLCGASGGRARPIEDMERIGRGGDRGTADAARSARGRSQRRRRGARAQLRGRDGAGGSEEGTDGLVRPSTARSGHVDIVNPCQIIRSSVHLDEEGTRLYAPACTPERTGKALEDQNRVVRTIG
jgi:hypothetical protein